MFLKKKKLRDEFYPDGDDINSLPEDKKQDHFLRQKRIWNELYGNAISSKRFWRTAAFLQFIVILALTAGLTWQGAQSKIIPYVVVLDTENNKIHQGIAKKTVKPSDRQIKSELKEFIQKKRLITTDIPLLKQNMHWVYAHLLPQTPAKQRLDEFFTANNPVLISKKKTKIVTKITSLLPITDMTWNAEWLEEERDINGELIAKDIAYMAIITIKVAIPQSDKQREDNPFGLWITDFQWEKKK